MSLEMKLKTIFDFTGNIGVKFDMYSRYHPTPLNLKQLLEFGRTQPASKSYSFLRSELPVRLANIMQELKLLPHSLTCTPSVQKIINMYSDSFQKLVSYETIAKTTPSVVSDFTQDLMAIFERHTNIIEYMAEGIKEMKCSSSFHPEEENQLHYFLDRFYTNRIGIRTLINQHTLLYGPRLNENEDYVGGIDPNCSPLRLVITAFAYARLLCQRVYGRAPGCDIDLLVSPEARDNLLASSPELDVQVDDENNHRPASSGYLFVDKPPCCGLRVRGREFSFCYIPGHLFHIIFELLKNAMRAVVEHRSEAEAGSSLERLRLIITCSNEDVTLRLTDPGGGMSRAVSLQAFRYTFTTASHLSPVWSSSIASQNLQLHRLSADSMQVNTMADPENVKYSPLAGRGHGLPLSRLFARYLNGDLQVASVQGHGTMAYIYLKRLPITANELLPVYCQKSRFVYMSRQSDPDWIGGTFGHEHLPPFPGNERNRGASLDATVSDSP